MEVANGDNGDTTLKASSALPFRIEPEKTYEISLFLKVSGNSLTNGEQDFCNLLAMEKLKIKLVEYFLVVALLIMFGSIEYLIIPEIANYEVFSYILGGGLMLYAIYFLIIFLAELVFKIREDSFVSIILSFVLFEVILLIFSGGSLIISLFDKENINLFLLFQINLQFVRVIPLYYRKFRVFTRSGKQ